MHFLTYDYPVVGSTNDEAKALLAHGAMEGTVVRATRQTDGRGRLGRQWISDPGNLYCSLILKPQCPLNQVAQLSFVIAIAVGETLLPFLSDPRLLNYKWPNDLLLDGKKVAGILIETKCQGEQWVEACIVGIGLNLKVAPNNTPYLVTALQNHAQSDVMCDGVFTELLKNIKLAYRTWQQEGFGLIREKWLRRVYGLGKEITITKGGKTLMGKFLGITPEGALLLQDKNGKVQSLMSAEIL